MCSNSPVHDHVVCNHNTHFAIKEIFHTFFLPADKDWSDFGNLDEWPALPKTEIAFLPGDQLDFRNSEIWPVPQRKGVIVSEDLFDFGNVEDWPLLPKRECHLSPFIAPTNKNEDYKPKKVKQCGGGNELVEPTAFAERATSLGYKEANDILTNADKYPVGTAPAVLPKGGQMFLISSKKQDSTRSKQLYDFFLR